MLRELASRLGQAVPDVASSRSRLRQVPLVPALRSLRPKFKRKGKRRLPARVKMPLAVPLSPNETRSADCMSDALCSGQRFRTFNVIDDFNREALRTDINTSISAARIVRALDELV